MENKLNSKEKIYVIGSIASGKTLLANTIAKGKNIPLYEEENIINYMNRKRCDFERELIFNNILNSNSWVIEGEYNDCLKEAIIKADLIILFDQPKFIIKFKILINWFKTKIQNSNRNYTPSIRILMLMLKFANEYENKKVDLKEELYYLNKKIIVIKNIKMFLKKSLV